MVNDNTATQKNVTVEKETPKKGLHAVEFWPTAEEAQKAAAGREKGARFVFTVTKDGKTQYATGAHMHYVGMRLVTDADYSIAEYGKAVRAPRSTAIDGTAILAALNGMPEAERKAIMEQLALLNAPKKTGVEPATKPAAKK